MTRSAATAAATPWSAGRGRDRISGGAAGDTLLSVDAESDTDDGGPGTDRCRADPIDTRTSCETT